jgi:hypothetical protein
LEHHSHHPSLIVHISHALIEWIRLRRTRTHGALLRANVWTSLSRLITSQQSDYQSHMSAEKINAISKFNHFASSDPSQFSLAHQLYSARCSVLKLLDYVVCSLEMKSLALREFYVINTIFSLLPEQQFPTIRWFALKLVTELMSVVHAMYVSSSCFLLSISICFSPL